MRLVFSVLFILNVLLVCNTSFADQNVDKCIPYRDEIISILNAEGVSSDYFYLAVCESRCQVKESHKGARGFFQLMPFTLYGTNIY